MAGQLMVLEGLGRLTKAGTVGPCDSDPKRCCTKSRVPANVPGPDFRTLCEREGLEVKIGVPAAGAKPKRRAKAPHVPPFVVEQRTQEQLAPGTVLNEGGFQMSRRRRRAFHDVADIAEYGEPWGDTGILDGIFDPEDLKGAGILLGSGALTLVAAPKLLGWIPDLKGWGVYVRGAVSLVGGFAAYKYVRSAEPDKRWVNQIGAAVGTVLMGLGICTILKQALPPAVSKHIDVSLGALPEEAALMAALDAIEDQPLYGLDAGEDEFGGIDAGEDEFGDIRYLEGSEEEGFAAADEFEADVESYNPGFEADVEQTMFPGMGEDFEADVEEFQAGISGVVF